jgi:hypothetical protein
MTLRKGWPRRYASACSLASSASPAATHSEGTQISTPLTVLI